MARKGSARPSTDCRRKFSRSWLEVDVGIEKKENRRDNYDPRELSSEPEEYGHKTRPIAERHEDGMAGLTDRFVERCEPVSRDPDLPLFRLSLMSSNPVQLRTPSPPQLASPVLSSLLNININIIYSVHSS